MDSCIIVHSQFEHAWPFTAEHFHCLWKRQGEVAFYRVNEKPRQGLKDIIADSHQVKRLVSLGMKIAKEDLRGLPNLQEAVFQPDLDEELKAYCEKAGIKIYGHSSEGYWGESVSECALALTLCGLRRIPQLHHEIISSHEPWNFSFRKNSSGQPIRGGQFCDDPRFTNGTVQGKRVRIVGIGNIGSRYASFMNMLGADVAAWDPFASDPCFHRSGARKIWDLDELIKDADIFAPMVPLTSATKGIVTSHHIDGLPKGCLVVLVTRAKICDVTALRKRVLADELALAADVHDIEPLPLDDPLLGRHNVVHTPHIAGRTMHANQQWAEILAAQFLPHAKMRLK